MTDWRTWADVPDEVRARVLRVMASMAHTHVEDCAGTVHAGEAVRTAKAIALAVVRLEVPDDYENAKRPTHIGSHYQVTEVGE